MPHSWDGYEGGPGARLAATYATVDAQDLHSWLADLPLDPAAAVLDVGAGSGRDAA